MTAQNDTPLPVECGNCGWTGKRKPGSFVICQKCGSIAAFQMNVERRAE